MFTLDGSTVRALDRLSTRGIAVHGGHLYRVITSDGHDGAPSDLSVYDAAGITRYLRLDGVLDAHDVLPRDDGVLVVSSSDSCVYSARWDGQLQKWWSVDVPYDAWHLNCITTDGDAVYATAFGMFDDARGWSRDVGAATGVLLELPSGNVVLKGLTQPHSPRRVDGSWIVCNSGNADITAYDDGRRVVQRRVLAGYTRGLAIDDTYLYVAESAHHSTEAHQRFARVTVLDRTDWRTVDSFEIPDCVDVYDLAVGPAALAHGVETGFATNPRRARQEEQRAMFAAAGVVPRRLWAVGDPLPAASLRSVIDIAIPQAMTCGESMTLPCSVTNRGDAIYVSAPPNPVEICYRWYDEAGVTVGAGEWIHTPLPHALPPGVRLSTVMRVSAPRAAGRYTLAVTLLQERVAWFDDVDRESGVRGLVTVREAIAATPGS